MTEDMTATSGQDYEGGEGTLVFEHGETTKTLEIVIHDDQVCCCFLSTHMPLVHDNEMHTLKQMCLCHYRRSKRMKHSK